MNNDTIKLLNLEGKDIDLTKSHVDKVNGELVCTIVLNNTTKCCKECGSIAICSHGYIPKRITHSISTNQPCILNYRARRFRCKDCGKTFLEHNPFCQEDEKISLYTNIKIMEKLKSHTSTFTSVAKDLNVSIQTVVNVFDNYASKSRLSLDEAICIDEIYTNKLTKKKYSCVIMNFKTKQVIDLYPSRLKYDLIENFMRIPLEERKRVKYVIIDMWDTYKKVGLDVFPNAIIAVDSFHVIKHLNLAIDMIRLRVMRKYDKGHSKLENAEMYYYMLKKFHYFFTKNYDNIYDGDIKIPKIHSSWDKHAIRKYLLEIDTDLNYAYNLKQEYQEFNLTAKYENCDEEFDKLINDFRSSHLKEFREFGKLLNHWRVEIKNSFIMIDAFTIDKKTNKIISIKKRLSNGPMEGCNSRIKCIIKNANGYRNFERFRKRVLFSINKNAPIRSYNKTKEKKDNNNKKKDK